MRLSGGIYVLSVRTPGTGSCHGTHANSTNEQNRPDWKRPAAEEADGGDGDGGNKELRKMK